MNLKFKSDLVLENDLKTLRQKELDLTAELLHHLLEVEMRDLHLARGFDSINAYCIKILGYSDDEAYVRIKAMRLIKVLPIAEEHLRDGSVGLTNLFKTQSALTREDKRRREEKEAPLTVEEKIEILEQVKHKSSRECEKVLAANYPDQKIHVEKIKPLSADRWLVELTISNELKEKIDVLLNLRAHTNFERKIEKLLEELVGLGLDRFDPVRRSAKRAQRAEARVKTAAAARAKKSSASGARDMDLMQNGTDARDQDFSDSALPQHFEDAVPPSAEAMKSESITNGADHQTKLVTNDAKSLSCHSDETSVQPSQSLLHQNRSADSFAQTSPVDFVVRNHGDLEVSGCGVSSGGVASLGASSGGVSSGGASNLELASIDVSKRRRRRPYVSIVTRDTIFTEANGQCTYVDHQTGRRCTSRHAVQGDHRVPFALGGSSGPENLRLLCWSHNQFEARTIFGTRRTSWVRESVIQYAAS